MKEFPPRCRKTATGKHYFKRRYIVGHIFKKCEICGFVDDLVEMKEADEVSDDRFFENFNYSKRHPNR